MIVLPALLFAAAVSSKPLLCVAGACETVRTELPVHVAANETARPFVWISADGQRVIAGIIPGGGTEAPADSGAAVTHRIVLRLSDSQEAPELSFELSAGGDKWLWSAGKPSGKPIGLAAPAGDLTLKITAPGFRKAEKKLSKPDETIYLYKLPIIRGRVVDSKTLLPLAGVEVEAVPSGEKISTTGRDGKFMAAIDAWPKSLRLTRPQYAPRMVEVPRTVTDTDLDVVKLSGGGAIHVVVAAPLGGREELAWTLQKVAGMRDEPVREGRIAAGETEFTVDRVEPGTYRIVIAGQGPLQKYAAPVTVSDDTVAQQTLRIQPAVLELSVTFDGVPLAHADIEAVHSLANWHGVVRCDDDGRAAEEIWQQGEYSVTVSRLPDVTGWVHDADIAGDGRIRVELKVPNRRIRGHVLDGSGAPVGGARVVLRSRDPSGENALMVHRDTGADGSFEFSGVIEGTQTLQVFKDGYVKDRRWQFTLGENDTTHDQELVIDRLEGPTIRVIDARGIPIVSAFVIVLTRNALREAGQTDGDGRIVVPVAIDEPAYVFAVPRSGSFGLLRLPSPGAASDAITMQVADGSATLALQTENNDGAPVPHITFLLRLDGLMIPVEVLQTLVNYQGVSLQTDARGELLFPHLPPGRYDIYAITGRDDFQAVYRSGSPPPPTATVTLTPGAQSLVIKLRAKETDSGSKH